MNALRTFYKKFPTIRLAKGDVLFHQKDVPCYGYAIKRGVMRICNLNSEGTEKTVSFKVADEVLPVYWLLSKTSTAVFYYQAHTDCELYRIKKENFIAHMNASPDFKAALLDILVRAYVDTSLQVDALLHARAGMKLLYTLRHLCLRYGKATTGGFTRIQIPLTQQDLANYTGLSRETTTIELNKLKTGGVISSRFKYYSVNTEKLNDHMSDDYDPGVEVNQQAFAKSFLL